MEWIIEEGKLSDAETIATFQIEMALESEGTVLDRDTILKGVLAGLSDDTKGVYYLVKDNNLQRVGSLFLTKEWSDWNNCWYWWIQSVYVKPQFRHNGAFKALYERVKELAATEGAASLRLYVDKGNAVAQKCYQNLGMEECHYLMFEDDNL